MTAASWNLSRDQGCWVRSDTDHTDPALEDSWGTSGDMVFDRLAYSGKKAALWRSQ